VDWLDGGSGHDTLTGGGSGDTFVFNGGADRVTDFQDNADTLAIDDALWGGASRSIDQVLAMARVSGGNVIFDFGGGHTLVIEGVNNIQFLRNDLILV
jgi:serralysin